MILNYGTFPVLFLDLVNDLSIAFIREDLNLIVFSRRMDWVVRLSDNAEFFWSRIHRVALPRECRISRDLTRPVIDKQNARRLGLLNVCPMLWIVLEWVARLLDALGVLVSELCLLLLRHTLHPGIYWRLLKDVSWALSALMMIVLHHYLLLRLRLSLSEIKLLIELE